MPWRGMERCSRTTRRDFLPEAMYGTADRPAPGIAWGDEWASPPRRIEFCSGLDQDAVIERLAASAGFLAAEIEESGAVVLPGILQDTTGFDLLARTLFVPFEAPFAISSPRTRQGAAIFTSTEFNPVRRILLHQELSYWSSQPAYCAFYCEEPAATGGETTLGSLAAISASLPNALLDEFARRGVRYRMSYCEGFDPTWQSAFETDDLDRALETCEAIGLAARHDGNGTLHVEFTAQGVSRAPDGQMLWANQAHLFHLASLDASLATPIVDSLGLEGLPRHCQFGDGAEIPAEAIAEVRTSFAQREFAHAWGRGDLLIVDNRRVMHGRRPFSGKRRVLAAFASAIGRREG